MRVRPLFLVALLARVATAQATEANNRGAVATVSGVVRDSIARVPLAGAMVQLVAADNLSRFGRTAISDSLGRFNLGDVPEGRYTLGFFHAMLDSLGMEPPLREVYVDGKRSVSADLAIPSPARLRAAICGPRSAPDSTALVVGVVRDAGGGGAAAGVTVTGEWLELSLRQRGMVRRVPRLVATTGANGWFAICNLPRTGMIVLMARRGRDSTGFIEVQMPAEGLLRRELYLAPPTGNGDAARPADSLARGLRRQHVTAGRLSGTVVTAVDGRPLAGAHVSIPNGPGTRANERGEWTLADAPLGTRMLDVRAVSYYPDRRPVDVVANAAPIRVELTTFKAVLDTVKVASSRLYNRDISGFQQRRRSSIGRYLTPEDIERRQPIVTSDLLRNVSGVRLEADSSGFEKQIFVRGSMSDWCLAAIYLNGRRLNGISADDLDGWVSPKEIAGIEIYAGHGTPAEYDVMAFPSVPGEGARCGSILIWTR